MHCNNQNTVTMRCSATIKIQSKCNVLQQSRYSHNTMCCNNQDQEGFGFSNLLNYFLSDSNIKNQYQNFYPTVLFVSLAHQFLFMSTPVSLMPTPFSSYLSSVYLSVASFNFTFHVWHTFSFLWKKDLLDLTWAIYLSTSSAAIKCMCHSDLFC